MEYPYYVRLPKYIGAAIRNQRKQKGWTLGQLADWTGTSIKFISNVEAGKATARLDKVFDLLKALELKVYLSDEELK